MAFSLALDAPVEKASRVSLNATPMHTSAAAFAGALPDEDLWLRSVKLAAPQSDVLSLYGERIFVTSAGRYYVPAQSDRDDILALRRNRDVAARVLAAATASLQAELTRRSPFAPTRGALLIAHMAGIEPALGYMQALASDPQAKAANAVPPLARLLEDTRSITLAQLEDRLNRRLHNQPQQIADGSDSGELRGTMTKTEAAVSAPAKLAARRMDQ
jgi:hypothetical protein